MNKDGCETLLSRISGFALAEENEKVWFSCLKTNGLYEFDRTQKQVRLLTRFADEPLNKSYLYGTVVKVENLLIMGSAVADYRVAFYDLATDRLEYLELLPMKDSGSLKYTKETDFLKCYLHEENVYLFGFEYPAIVKVNVTTKEIAYLTDWVDKVKQKVKKPNAPERYLADYVTIGDFVWILCIYADVVLRLDLRTDEVEIIDICTDLDMHCGICYDGSFWLAGNNESANKLLKYDNEFLLQEEIEVYSARKDGDTYLYPQTDTLATYPLIDMGEKMLLFSSYPKHVYEFDKMIGKVKVHPAFEKLLETDDEMFCELGILAPRRKGDNICFITGNDFLWNEYDFVHDIMIRYEVRSGKEEELIKEMSKFLQNRVFMENKMVRKLGYKLTLPRYLEHMIYLPIIREM